MGRSVDEPVARILTFMGAEATQEDTSMLWTLFMVLVVLWLLGVATSYTAGGLIHLLLVVAIVVMLVRVIQGRRPV
jgi:fatty acid desaturase